jgi:hypothetical protein
MPSYVCSIEQEISGQLVANVIAFAQTDTLGAETGAGAAAVANQVAIAWKARIIPGQASSLKFLQVVARGVNDAGIVGTSIEAAANGAQAGASLPAFAAVRVAFGSDTPRRAGRGRTGISGVLEVDSDVASPNNLSAAARTAWATRVSGLITDLAANTPTIFPVVVSRVLNRVPRPAPLVSPVTTTAVQLPLGTRVSRIR